MSARTAMSRFFVTAALGAMTVVAQAASAMDDPASSPQGAPNPPSAPAPLYSGPSSTVAAPIELCGVHEFDSLTVAAAVRVSHTADADDPFGTGAACPAGFEDTLELRANTLVVESTGVVDGDGVTTDVPHFDADADYPECAAAVGQPLPSPAVKCPPGPYRATGNSGGTHAGVGFVGAYPDSGVKPYETDAADAEVFPGSPGSFQSQGYHHPDVDADGDPNNGVHTAVPAAGTAGYGGGAVVLKADQVLEVRGAVTADGAHGAGDDSGSADNDPMTTASPGGSRSRVITTTTLKPRPSRSSTH